MTRFTAREMMALGIAGLAVIASAAPVHAPRIQDAADELITVPLVVSLHDGSTLQRYELVDVIGRVNAIYAPAGVRFAVVEADTDVRHPGDGDAQWTRHEREMLRADRRGYLDHLFGRLQGVAVSFTRQPKADKPTTNGVAYGESGVVILRRHPTGLSKTAQTLAHELAHTMGLSDLYEARDANRLRYGYSSTRTDVTLTEDDIRQVRSFAARRAGQAWAAGANADVPVDSRATVGVSETESRLHGASR